MGVSGKWVWQSWRVWVCMDESLEREMGMRDVSGSEGYVHGNENGFAWEWEWACMDGNGFAWMRV